jgi:phosphohistidine phosphatase SixA
MLFKKQKSEKREVVLSNSTMTALETVKKVLQHLFQQNSFTMIDSHIVFHKMPKDMAIKKSCLSKMSISDFKKTLTGEGEEERNVASRILESKKSYVFAVNMSVRVRCNSKITTMELEFTLESEQGLNWHVVPYSSIDITSEVIPFPSAGFYYKKGGILAWNKIPGKYPSLDEVRKILPEMKAQPQFY